MFDAKVMVHRKSVTQEQLHTNERKVGHGSLPLTRPDTGVYKRKSKMTGMTSMLELEVGKPNEKLRDDTPSDRPTRCCRHKVAVSEVHENLTE